jgi:hypothetical protein
VLLNEPGKEPPKADDKPVVPEKYADFTVPEGYTLDPEIAKEAGELFKKTGLTQEAAQSFVDFYAAKTKEAFEAPFKAWTDTQEKWVNELKNDPEIGGKLDLVKATVSKAIDSLPPQMAKDFREAMEFTGAGNNPAFVRALYRLSSQLTEGRHIAGGGPVDVKNPSNKPPSAAAALYPNLAQGT